MWVNIQEEKLCWSQKQSKTPSWLEDSVTSWNSSTFLGSDNSTHICSTGTSLCWSIIKTMLCYRVYLVASGGALIFTVILLWWLRFSPWSSKRGRVCQRARPGLDRVFGIGEVHGREWYVRRIKGWVDVMRRAQRETKPSILVWRRELFAFALCVCVADQTPSLFCWGQEKNEHISRGQASEVIWRGQTWNENIKAYIDVGL